MKMQDIIVALQKSLPIQSNFFCTKSDISAARLINDQIYFVSENHGLKSGDHIIISDVKNGLLVSSFSVNENSVTFTFERDHGLCGSDVGFLPIEIKVEEEYHTGILTDVADKLNFTVKFNSNVIPDNPIVIIYYLTNEGFNGFYEIVSTTQNSFNVKITSHTFLPPLVYIKGGQVSSMIRITGAADMDRFNAAYTAQKDEYDCWLVVVPPENRSSRSRQVTTDAISGYMDASNHSASVELRQTHIETLKLYAVIPASAEISGRRACDMAEEVRWSLYACLIGHAIPTIAKDGYTTATVPVSDNYFAYLSDNTTYVHEYVFERSVIVETSDIFHPDDRTAPFRGLDLKVFPCDHNKVKPK